MHTDKGGSKEKWDVGQSNHTTNQSIWGGAKIAATQTRTKNLKTWWRQI